MIESNVRDDVLSRISCGFLGGVWGIRYGVWEWGMGMGYGVFGWNRFLLFSDVYW